VSHFFDVKEESPQERNFMMRFWVKLLSQCQVPSSEMAEQHFWLLFGRWDSELLPGHRICWSKFWYDLPQFLKQIPQMNFTVF